MCHLLRVDSLWVLVSDSVYDWKIKSVDGIAVPPPRILGDCAVNFSQDRQSVLWMRGCLRTLTLQQCSASWHWPSSPVQQLLYGHTGLRGTGCPESCGCPFPEGAQGQVKGGTGQPDLMWGSQPMAKELELDHFWGLLQPRAILWFYIDSLRLVQVFLRSGLLFTSTSSYCWKLTWAIIF